MLFGNTAEPEPKPCGFYIVCTLSGTAGHVDLAHYCSTCEASKHSLSRVQEDEGQNKG